MEKIVNHPEWVAPYLAGKSTTEVAKMFGVDASTVYRHLKKIGIPMRGISESLVGKTGWNKGVALPTRKYDYDDIRARYERGESLNAIAAAIGAGSAELVRSALKRMGVQMRKRGAASGTENHQYKGGKGVTKDGYVTIRGKQNPPMEHRVIAEKALGKKLPKGVIVHHVDTDRANNANTNLVICTSAYHAELHERMRLHPYWSQFKKS